MTVTLTTQINIPNVVGFRAIAFDLVRGAVTLRFGNAGGARFVDVECRLSDTAGASTGVKPNPAPARFDDFLMTAGGGGPIGGSVGAANSLTNAIAAYRGAANHNAGLKAVELQGLTDGWIDAAFVGT